MVDDKVSRKESLAKIKKIKRVSQGGVVDVNLLQLIGARPWSRWTMM
jgi:hypothetical protein